MPTYKILGIDVDFPFEAYDCQLVYMEKVIQALQGKCNALLESPTGTGKTLCLLCATLAWRKSLGPFSTGVNARNSAGSKSDGSLSQSAATNLPTIVYTSRTHSQLRQVIQELKRSSYRPKMVVLGSREQLCIHEKVSLLRGKAQTNVCRSLCRKRLKQHCSHFPRATEYVKVNPGLGDEPVDIEDLVNIGRSCGACPYYLSRELHKVVDIMFAPYNYLIDPAFRKSLNLQWDNSILIFDEAHNLEGLCADAASFDLHSGLLTACISEAKNCIDLCVERREISSDKSRNPDNFAILRALLLKLEKRIADIPIQSKELGFTKPGAYIYELLADLNITHKTSSKLIETIEDAVVLLEEEKLQQTKNNGCRLETMNDILKMIFKDGSNSQYYKVHVQEVASNTADTFKDKASRTFSWWCFNPGIAMEEFSKKGVGSVILTSGTLSPMDSFAQELKLEFPIRLENPHVISPNQIWAGVVPSGPSGCAFNSSFRNRDSLEYKQELGNAIVNFARIVPDGLLVFFPSYYLLDQCIGCWKNGSNVNSAESKTIWERICKHKQPVVEPRQSSLFLQSIEDYMAKLKDTSTSGAVFFAVCRGKVSEGLDFADHAGRAVIVTGMPFATRTDPKVRLKREYLDQQALSQRGQCKVLTGEEWYNQQASRAVNQAVGRVIRHRHDYGAIIFCDERFAHSNRQSQISLWIQPHIKCYSKFGDVVFTLTRFFRDGGSRGPTKQNQIKDRGNIQEMKTMQLTDKFDQEKSISQTLQMGQDFAGKSLSSILEFKRSNISSQLGEILPANRSSLNPYKKNDTLLQKCSNDLFLHKKRLLVRGRESIQYPQREIIDLTDNTSIDEKPKGSDPMAPCSSKKHKIMGLGHDAKSCIEASQEHPSVSKMSRFDDLSFSYKSSKHKRSGIFDSQSMPVTDISSSLLPENDGAAQEKDNQYVGQKNKAIRLGPGPGPVPVSSGDKETIGSAFLNQVKEKLSASEYIEFVNLIKALRSKAVKIGQIFQSIARLFSGRERLPLLTRFKDYVPANYRSLYEQYLESNAETVAADK